MNKKQLTHLEKRLLEERARVMKELGHYDESFNATPPGLRRRPVVLLVPHGRPGHRCHGTGEAVPVRVAGGAVPLAREPGPAPAVQQPRRLRHVRAAAGRRSTSSGSTRCRTPGSASAARKRKRMPSAAERRLFWRHGAARAAARRRHQAAWPRRTCCAPPAFRWSATGCSCAWCTTRAPRSACTWARTPAGSSWPLALVALVVHPDRCRRGAAPATAFGSSRSGWWPAAPPAT